jgi:hypothetical protein
MSLTLRLRWALWYARRFPHWVSWSIPVWYHTAKCFIYDQTAFRYAMWKYDRECKKKGLRDKD